MKIPIYKGSVDNKDDEVRLSCSDVKICDKVEVENDQKVSKPKLLKKGAHRNGRFPLTSKIY